MHVSLVSESPSEKKAKFKNSYKIFIKPESVYHLGCESRQALEHGPKCVKIWDHERKTCL